MAEGLLKKIYGEYYDVYSGGSDPKPINPLTMEVMAEIEVDISGNESKNMEIFRDREFDCVVTLCGPSNESCPVFIGAKSYIHQGFRDPKNFKGTENDKRLMFCILRDEISEWIEKTFKP
jgi:arsenate reductase (thioredoxin)